MPYILSSQAEVNRVTSGILSLLSVNDRKEGENSLENVSPTCRSGFRAGGDPGPIERHIGRRWTPTNADETAYNGESFFVRHEYFTSPDEPAVRGAVSAQNGAA